MKAFRTSRIVAIVLAVFAAGVLFATYGTALLDVPFTQVQLNGPSVANSNGKMAAIADTESRRVLILNSEGDLTGVIDCDTVDSPIDAVTDVRVSGDYVHVAGVRYSKTADEIETERVAVYDKGGNLQWTEFQVPGGNDSMPEIKALCENGNGITVAYMKTSSAASSAQAVGADDSNEEIAGESAQSDQDHDVVMFATIDEEGYVQSDEAASVGPRVFDVAFAPENGGRYVTLSVRGQLDDTGSAYSSQVYANRVFTAIDLGNKGKTLYACDDVSGSLCAISIGETEVREIVQGVGYDSVSASGEVLSLVDRDANKVVFADLGGNVQSDFTSVAPSIGFSLRMLLVWASGLYLIGLVLFAAVRKVVSLAKEGRMSSIGPLLAAVATVMAVGAVLGGMSFRAYNTTYETRANEVNMCADYLEVVAPDLSEAVEAASNRGALQGGEDELLDAIENIFKASWQVDVLVEAANKNGIGMYYVLYGKDSRGVCYLTSSSQEFVLGTTVRQSASNEALMRAFDNAAGSSEGLISGRSLRDSTQYRLVTIPSSDGQGVAGVIEVGNKMRALGASTTGELVTYVVAMLVLVLVVYLAYCELRACGARLFEYRERRKDNPHTAPALLTRPFTLAVTMLSSIDSVMTVLIARDLLTQEGMEATSPLLGIPAVMLGVGLIIGQGLYGYAGSRVGLRRLACTGAIAMLIIAILADLAVAYGGFWMYCLAKLALAVPFGLLYTLGYSLPRLAEDEDARAQAAGDVRRTDTSAAALGTVLGGYAAQMMGNQWVYALVALVSVIVIIMAMRLMPEGERPLEAVAQPSPGQARISDFVKTRRGLSLALFVVLPATIAAGYTSFLFPLFSSDLGLSKADINNIFVLGQLVVFISIGGIEGMTAKLGAKNTATSVVLLMGVVFLLFSINTTLAWSVAVIAIVGVLGKASDAWKGMWTGSAVEMGVPAGRAVGAMLATRSVMLIAQPFIMTALLNATSAFAVIVIGVLCVLCAVLFYLANRRQGETA